MRFSVRRWTMCDIWPLHVFRHHCACQSLSDCFSACIQKSSYSFHSISPQLVSHAGCSRLLFHRRIGRVWVRVVRWKTHFCGDTTHRRQRNSTKLGSRMCLNHSAVQHWLICHKSPCNWSTTQYWWIFILEISGCPTRKRDQRVFFQFVSRVEPQRSCRKLFSAFADLRSEWQPLDPTNAWTTDFFVSDFVRQAWQHDVQRQKSSPCRWWGADSDARDKSLKRTQRSAKHPWLRLCPPMIVFADELKPQVFFFSKNLSTWSSTGPFSVVGGTSTSTRTLTYPMCAACALKGTPQDRKGSLCPIVNFFLPFFPFIKKDKENEKQEQR